MKITILTCNTGQGHNSASKVLSEEFAARGAEVETRDALAFAGEHASELVAGALVHVAVNAPRAFGLMYGAAERISSDKLKSPIYLANKLYADNLQKYLEDNEIDAVVCPHLFPAEALTSIRLHGDLRTRCYFVSTDYTCIPFLAETQMDAVFVPAADLLPEFTERGISRERLRVSGIPVSSAFREHMDRADARREFGIADDVRAYLVMTGGEGCGDPVEITSALLARECEDIRVIVLPGRNDELKKELGERFGDDARVMIIGFTDRVPALMDACDVLLTKPGGISSTEAAVHGVPMIHTAPIPGVETQNAQFFAERAMSVLAADADNAALNAIRLASDESARRRMLEAQRQYIARDPAKTIADVIFAAE